MACRSWPCGRACGRGLARPDAIGLLIEPSLTDFLTPAFSEAGIVRAEINPHPNGDGDRCANQDYDFDYSHTQAVQTIPVPGPLAACAARRLGDIL
jgi:hypothetical protein